MDLCYIRPETIGNEIMKMNEAIDKYGKNIIEELYTTIENLKKHWKGSDAEKNLEELKTVYYYITVYLRKLKALTAEINNKEIIPLQKHIRRIGGSCPLNEPIDSNFNGITIDIEIQIPKGSIQSWTHELFINDIENLNKISNWYETFVKVYHTQKEEILRNWTEGGTYREKIVQKFTEYEDELIKLIKDFKIINNNLNIIVNIKKQIL